MSTCIELINFNLLSRSRSGHARYPSPGVIFHDLVVPGVVDKVELSVGSALRGASFPWRAFVGLYSSAHASDDFARGLELYVARSGALPPGAVHGQDLAVDGWGSTSVDLDPRWVFNAGWVLGVRMGIDLAWLNQPFVDWADDFRVTAHLSYTGGVT